MAEEPSSRTKPIGIYNLDENNREILTNLRKCLTEKCSVKYYKKLESYDNFSIGAAVSTLRCSKKFAEFCCYFVVVTLLLMLYFVLPFNIFSVLITGLACISCSITLPSAFRKTSFPSYEISAEDLDLLTSEQLTALLYDDDCDKLYDHYDVVMILGHSNIYHVGPFDTSDVIEAILTKHKPSIIALLGCCGGGTRYGPLMKISQMGSKTIFGFYQRRIYPDELVETSLVLGIRNYFHLKNYFHKQASKPAPRVIIRRSFACAALDIPLNHDDPSIFANDSDEPGTIQNLFKVFHNKFTANCKPIPLACLQLALFHVFTVEKSTPNGSPTINTFIEKIKQVNENKIEEECKSELKKRHLDKIISLTAEILLLPVLEETLDKLKIGKWQDVDPLQFMIATLHGYWGKNSYTMMRCCAQYHHDKLKEVAMGTRNEDVIHRYHLGSIALCLFCESTYVNFDLPSKNLAFQIESLAQVQIAIKFDCVEPIFVKKLPEQSGLIWENEHYKHMNTIDDKFIKLFSEATPGHELHISNYRNKEKTFGYTTAQFKGALNTLQTSLCPLLQGEDDINKTKAPYFVKKFDNVSSESKGRMKCFKPWPRAEIKYKYAEMRIIDDPAQISQCRFVYQYHHNTEEECCVGMLYFTDSHYGWDLISEEELDRTLKEKHKFKDKDLKDLGYFAKQAKISKRELYQLQDNITGTFPFQSIGMLRIWKKSYTLERNKINI